MLKLLEREVDGGDITELYRYEDDGVVELYLKHRAEDGGYTVRILSLRRDVFKVEYYLVAVTPEAKGKWLIGERELDPSVFEVWVEHIKNIDSIDDFCKLVEMYFP
jgi:hypothetical protein